MNDRLRGAARGAAEGMKQSAVNQVNNTRAGRFALDSIETGRQAALDHKAKYDLMSDQYKRRENIKALLFLIAFFGFFILLIWGGLTIGKNFAPTH